MLGTLRCGRVAIQQNTLSSSTGRLNSKQDVNFGTKQEDQVYCDITTTLHVRSSLLGAFV